MENASKALLIAGSMLIGILVISLIVYLYAYFGRQAKDINETIIQSQLTKYNAQYTVYEGRKDLTVYDVVSIINTAYENNVKHQDELECQVKVYVEGIDRANTNNTNFSNDIIYLIKNNYETKYKCTKISFYNSNGKVEKIIITKVIT